jgi:hypothetical protein
MLQLLTKLPSELEYHHFGDCDPAGLEILHLLREESGRHIRPFLMDYRPGWTEKSPVSEADINILQRVRTNGESDLQEALNMIEQYNSKGLFEQENYGKPDLAGWPFYKVAMSG